MPKKRKAKVDPNLVSEVMREMGKRGGTERAKRIAAGELVVKPAGAAVPKPTMCPRCGKMQPSARAAWTHCRTPKTKAAVSSTTRKAKNA